MAGFGRGKKRIQRGHQLSFADRRRKDGKARLAPGPKPKPRAKLLHRARPSHSAAHPLHITLRAVNGLPTFRSEMISPALELAVRDTRRTNFRVVEFSVQSNHLHMIVEAQDKRALANGMKSFSVRANRLVNARLKKLGVRRDGRGPVWADRYHRRDLTSPRQVRNALVYCLNNYRKHEPHKPGSMRIDPCSSARWFQGWIAVRKADEGPPATADPKTKLLGELWKRHGLIHPGEAPRRPS